MEEKDKADQKDNKGKVEQVLRKPDINQDDLVNKNAAKVKVESNVNYTPINELDNFKKEEDKEYPQQPRQTQNFEDKTLAKSFIPSSPAEKQRDDDKTHHAQASKPTGEEAKKLEESRKQI